MNLRRLGPCPSLAGLAGSDSALLGLAPAPGAAGPVLAESSLWPGLAALLFVGPCWVNRARTLVKPAPAGWLWLAQTRLAMVSLLLPCLAAPIWPNMTMSWFFPCPSQTWLNTIPPDRPDR